MNLAIFYFEVMNDREKAIEIAEDALNMCYDASLDQSSYINQSITNANSLDCYHFADVKITVDFIKENIRVFKII
jgi:hypothetical protein